MKIRGAILGVGRWGVHWVRNFRQHPQAEIVAIVDSLNQRLSYCREQFNLDPDRVLLTTDWNLAKRQKNIDAVVVATPASTHYSLIADALELGYHVLAEKPLTLDSAECLKLTRLAEQKQLLLLVDHNYLFHPVVARGKEIVKSKKLGQLRYGYASRTHLGPVRQDVDVLWDLAIHDLAIFNHWLGQTPIQVQAKGNVWLQPEKQARNSQGLADLVWVNLIYPDGFQAYIHLCWLNPDKQRRLCVVGTQGSLIFDEMSGDAPLTFHHGSLQQQGELFIPMNQACEVVAVESAEPLQQVCDHFLANINSPTISALSSGWIGTELVQILSCLSQSLKQEGALIEVPRAY